ncbi:hypothetical protein D9Q98_003906 [Chlorella vulgaris]|uniref:Exostosin GT47 domain-containing protein n=1 Tax=Chlorella vulgaris TaxID=3077 RepID=A0A9D4TQY2_CHLVU|nr:hypothetical protein D9Q98_003906 [Chlorella vulgaris]
MASVASGFHEAFCPNQCNGHGECNLGFCKCQAGWLGYDCAYRLQGVPWSPGMEDVPHRKGALCGLHEMLLQSEHRTLDASEADYFYVPVYSCCLIYPVAFATDSPYFDGGAAASRIGAASNLLLEVFHWVRSHHPWWDRNDGRDQRILSIHLQDARHPVWQREGHVLSKLGAFPCYDPRKDLTVPLMWSPNKYGLSPLLGAPTREHDILAFFKGQ